MTVVLLKTAVLIAAFLGYAAHFQRKRYPLYFFPFMAVAAVTTGLYLSAFFGMLRLMSLLVLAGGVASLVFFLRKAELKAILREESLWYFVVCAVWLYVITRGGMLAHWDDGSHWYRICKAVHYEHGFASTPDILYYDYVPGCAIWVYLITHIIGFSIPNCMFAQGLISIACLCTLFAGLRDIKARLVRGIGWMAIAAAGVTLSSMSVSTYTLMVDLQVGLAALAALILAIEMGERREAVISLLIALIFLSTIKNSSLIFVAAVTVWATVQHRFKGRKLAVRLLLWMGVPLLLFALYQLRCKLAYPQTDGGLQSISLNRYISLFAEKDPALLLEITKNFLYQLFIGETNLSLSVYMWLLTMGVYGLGLKVDGEEGVLRQVACCTAAGLALLAVYTAGLYMTYLFAMNGGEAVRVNSFYRYYGSGVIVFVGSGFYMAMRQIAKIRSSRVFAMGMLLFAMLGMPGAYSKKYILGQNEYHIPEDYHSQLWWDTSYLVAQNQTYTPESYLVLWDSRECLGSILENQRVEYIVGAWTRSDHVLALDKRLLEENGLDEKTGRTLQAYDHLVVLTDFSGQEELLAPYLYIEDMSKGTRDIICQP